MLNVPQDAVGLSRITKDRSRRPFSQSVPYRKKVNAASGESRLLTASESFLT